MKAEQFDRQPAEFEGSGAPPIGEKGSAFDDRLPPVGVKPFAGGIVSSRASPSAMSWGSPPSW
jgi:hypothetical protein